MISDLASLTTFPEHLETRWFSPENWDGARGAGGATAGGRKGSPLFKLASGASKVLAHVEGRSGCVRRIWMTMSDKERPDVVRSMRLRMWWDGASTPAVDVPLGDFFCHGLGQLARFRSVLFSSPEGRSFVCMAPMPFRTGMRIELTNESGIEVGMIFYDVDVTLGDKHGPDMLYFHATWRRERPTTMQKDFTVLPQVRGRGRWLGACFSVICDRTQWLGAWWGEGEIKVFLDGDQELPTLCGTGTEDWIGTAFAQGQFDDLYSGCPVADLAKQRFSFFRHHVTDPVIFHRDCRVTIHQIGCWGPLELAQFTFAKRTIYRAGPGLVPHQLEGAHDYLIFERSDDWAACAWFYLDAPENGLPPLAPVTERIAAL